MAGEGMFTRRIAPNVRERHSKTCGRSTGAGRCTCTPSYIARVGTRDARQVATFDDATEASNWVRDTRIALREGRAYRGTAPTLARAAQHFMQRAHAGEALTRSRKPYAQNTVRSYERQLRLRVLPHVDLPTGRELAELPVDEIDARTVQRLVDAIVTTSGGEAARQAAAALAALLRDLYVQGVVDTLPPKVLLPSPNPPSERVLTHTEYARLLDGCRRDDARLGRSLLFPLVALLGASGGRVSEIVSLRWGPGGIDANHQPPQVQIQRDTTKTDAGHRTVSLDHEIATILNDQRAANGNPPDGTLAFTRKDGSALNRSGLVRFGMQRASRLAGLTPVTPHVLRHSHASWAASANVPTVALAARLGHADPSFTLRRYAHAAARDLADIPDTLLRHRDRPTPAPPKGDDAKMTTHQHSPAGRASRPGTRVNRPGLVEQYEHEVLPALQTRLAEAFPEFGWRRDPNGWHATNNTHTHERLGVRADRIVSHGDAPAGFLIHGQGAVLWTTYVNGGTPARGHQFVTAVRAIAARVNIELDSERSPTRDQRREGLLRDVFAIAHEEYLSDAGTNARRYLIDERGFPRETIASLNLGVMPSLPQLTEALLERGHRHDEIADSKVASDPRWAGRLVGIWNDERGRPRTLWARTTTSVDRVTPRYLYLAGARRPAVPYGLDEVLRQSRGDRPSLVLVEGVLDLHHLHARGFERVAALGGTTTPPALFERLARLDFDSVRLVLDADRAGERGTVAAIDAAFRGRISPEIEVVRLTEADDPDELLRQSGIEGWTRALQVARSAIAWRVAAILSSPAVDDASNRGGVQRAGEWLGTLGARHALEQDAGIQLVANTAGLDLEATRREFRHRYWTTGVEAGPDVS